MAGGVESDDEDFSNEQLIFIINYYRAALLKRDQEKNRFDKSLYVQTLGNVKLTLTDRDECCAEGCNLRTALPIPAPLETYKGLNITFVGTVDGEPFTKTQSNITKWVNSAKYTKGTPKWYYKSGYIYILNTPSMLMESVTIEGVFEDPIKAEEFKICECIGAEKDCNIDPIEMDYPLPVHHLSLLTQMIMQSEIAMLHGLPKDTTNDSKD